jgi:hypothetical protein
MADGDKRSVSTDALETLGMVHLRDEKRDAIHLAVMPVEAGETLGPGEDIWVSEGGRAFAGSRDRGIGIVDPFLTRPVRFKERFWLVIYPRKIQSLRHVWSHPELPDELPAQPAAPVDSDKLTTARQVIHAVAVDLGVSDEALMDGAKQWLKNGSHMHFGVDLSYDWDMPAFWDAYSVLTGEHVPQGSGSFFSCSC